MVWLTQAASMCWVVGVESTFLEFASAQRVVVSYCAEVDAPGYDADGVACEYVVAEGLVSTCVVTPVPCCTPSPVRLGGACGAASTLPLVQGWASGHVAHAHGVPRRFRCRRESEICVHALFGACVSAVTSTPPEPSPVWSPGSPVTSTRGAAGNRNRCVRIRESAKRADSNTGLPVSPVVWFASSPRRDRREPPQISRLS
jgi:hypothetical protein